jgi:MFS family permease
LGAAALFFVNGAVVGSWLPRLPEIRDRLDVDLGALGLTLALGGLGSLIGSSISGVVVTRFGARRTALVGAVVLYLILPFVAVAPTAALLAVVLALMGFVDSQADVGMNAVGIRVEEGLGRSIMTRLHGLWSLGTLVGSGVSALAVLLGIGLGPQLVTVSLVGLATVLVAARLIPESVPRTRSGARSGALALGLMLAGGTAVFIEGAPFDWSAIFLIDVTGAGDALAGTGEILFTGGMLVGRMAGDHLVDRFGPVRTLFAGLVLSVIAMLVVVTANASTMALIAFAVWGLGISVALPVLYKLAGSHRSFGEGSGLAALTVGTRLGFMVAPALIGIGATAWGLPEALAIIVGIAAVSSMIAIRLTIGAPKPLGDSLPGSGVS